MDFLKSSLKPAVLYYLKIASKIQLAKIKPKVVGVGGSSGKTSTTSFIETILQEKYIVRDTHGKNSETGIPLSILGISIYDYSFLAWVKIALLVPVKLLSDFKKYEYFVAEMGVDGPNPPNNMGYLLGIVSPQTAVLTNITYEHSLNFENLAKGDKEFEETVLQLIAGEELKLLTTLSENNVAILNIDDELVSSSLGIIKAKKITVSSKKPADFKINDISITENNFVLDFSFREKNFKLKIDKPLPSYFSYSFILAIATCYAEGISVEESVLTLEKSFVLPPGRASIFAGIKNTKIIDSSYNSSLEASEGMLDLLKVLGNGRRKVAIIGDIREQGKMSKKLHEKLAKSIMKTADFCILIGPQVNQFIVPIFENEKFVFESFKTFSEAKDKILDLINDGDIVLIKGSQNTLLLERAVEILLKDKKDAKFLARRGNFWEKVRNNTA